MGKIARIDLSMGSVQTESISEGICRKFIGGTGLAAYLLSQYSYKTLDPLGPENILVFATGPLTGTSVPTSGRYAVAAKSPLTGIWGEADSGSRFGISLKNAGYDALVITGKCNKPAYLFINELKITICPAEELWGKDTYETFDMLQDKHGIKAGVVCIGPAGENLVPLASIMSEGKNGRAAGRCGLGAVMGSKNLKAIVSSGNLNVPVFDSAALKESIKKIAAPMIEKQKRLRDYGTAGAVVGNAALGDMSAYNWTDGDCVDKAASIGGDVMAEYTVSRYHCYSCPVGCGKTVRITKGPYSGSLAGGPEYETIAGFGAQCGNWDMEVVIEANDLCNRLGVDTISMSGTISFLFEAVQRGLLKTPAGSPTLTWGNGEAIISLINDSITGNGLGALVASGVRQAAKILGPEAESFALHVKGLEFPYHDPRAIFTLAVDYATSPRGACHRGCALNLERFAIPSIGFPEVMGRFDGRGKGSGVAIIQNYAELFNSLKLCQLCMRAYDLPLIVNWLNLITGWDMDSEELLKAGERSLNLKRLLNISCGLTGEDDTLPYRILKEKFPSGGAANKTPDLKTMLAEYYETRGWDQNGFPTPEKLKELGLVAVC